MTSSAVCFAVLLLECRSCKRILAKRASEMIRMPFLAESIDAFARDRFAATFAQRSDLKVIVQFAVGFLFEFEEATFVERFLAIVTNEASRVPLLSECADAVCSDSLTARTTSRSEELEVIRFAIGFAVFGEKLRTVVNFGAFCAGQMLGMPFLAKCHQYSISDDLIALCATRRLTFHPAFLAVVGILCSSVEIVSADLLLACSA